MTCVISTHRLLGSVDHVLYMQPLLYASKVGCGSCRHFITSSDKKTKKLRRHLRQSTWFLYHCSQAFICFMSALGCLLLSLCCCLLLTIGGVSAGSSSSTAGRSAAGSGSEGGPKVPKWLKLKWSLHAGRLLSLSEKSHARPRPWHRLW